MNEKHSFESKKPPLEIETELVLAPELTQAQIDMINSISESGHAVPWRMSEGQERTSGDFDRDFVVMSEVNEKSKFSMDYSVCLGLIVTDGVKSFLLHAPPSFIIRDLPFYQKAFRERCSDFDESKSIAVVMFGGSDDPEDEYDEAATVLQNELQESLSVEYVSTYATSDKNSRTHHVFFDQENSKLLVVRVPAPPSLGELLSN